jgi:hypothetical protein
MSFEDPNVQDSAISRSSAGPLVIDRIPCVINSSNQIAAAPAGGYMDGVLVGAVDSAGTETTIYTEGPLLVRASGTCTQGAEAMLGVSGVQDVTAGNVVVGRFCSTTNTVVGQYVWLILYDRAQALYSRERVAMVPLVGATIHAGVMAWQNPEGVPIVVTRAVVAITTVATAAATLDLGTTTVSAVTASDTLLDGIDIHAAADALGLGDQTGTNGKGTRRLAAGKWVTIKEDSGDATGLVAKLFIFYLIE